MSGWAAWTSVSIENNKVWVFRNPRYPYPLNNEITEWLAQNVGEKAEFYSQGPTGDWHHTIPLSDPNTIFYFRNPAHAMLFKLTFV